MNGTRTTTGVTMLGLVTGIALLLGAAAAGNTTGPGGRSAPTAVTASAQAGIAGPDQDFPWN